MNENELAVWWLADPAAPSLVGTAVYTPATRATSFTYEAQWIADGFALSGDMPLGRAAIVTVGGELPGAFSDALPDRWGERVIAATAPLRRTEPFDYLYYAGDSRFGALGFSRSRDRYEPHGPDHRPRIASLPAMAELIERINTRAPLTEEQKLLVNSSKALGGAHPKALVVDGEVEWIAKFARGQNTDAALVEHASMRLAERAGIQVAPTRVERLATGHVILVRRFDRNGARRIHALSAHTALMRGLTPAIPPESERSYPALASILRPLAPKDQVASQQREVFRRMAFNILVENVDDHEKNHALIRVAEGWLMSPAYDVLPTTTNVARTDMMIGTAGAEESLANALSRVALFGLTREQAIDEWFAVAKVVGTWKEFFAGLGVPGSDIDYLKTFVDDPDRVALRRREP